MQRRTAGVLAGTAVTALVATMVAGPASAGSSASSAPVAVGLTNTQKLVKFPVNRPGSVTRIGAVSGLAGDTEVVGIDFRVQDGKLYGVGDQGGVYTLSTTNGAATKVAQLSVAPDGENFGVDFNPAANALRVVSDTGQNLRYAFMTGATTADGSLTYPPATATVTGVSAAAYTNNDLADSTATTLFDLDTALDQVAAQAPANAGSLSPTGKLGVDAGADAGFDIFSDLQGGVTEENHGLATLSSGGKYRLYQVSLLTGDADVVAQFPASAQVSDLAVMLDK